MVDQQHKILEQSTELALLHKAQGSVEVLNKINQIESDIDGLSTKIENIKIETVNKIETKVEKIKEEPVNTIKGLFKIKG